MTESTVDEICGYWPKHPVSGDEGIGMDVAVRDLLTLIKETQRLQRIVRHMRETWFNCHLHQRPPYREWESTLSLDLREEANRETRTEYERQTARLLSGDDSVPLTPRCAADMEEAKRD